MDYKILVPIDFTEISENALKYAIGAAKPLGTGICLLHIADSEEKKITSMEGLEALIYKYEGHGVSLKPITTMGSIFETIAETAEQEGVGIIFMGTHGMKGLQRLIGSNALRVITKSKVPFVIPFAEPPLIVQPPVTLQLLDEAKSPLVTNSGPI